MTIDERLDKLTALAESHGRNFDTVNEALKTVNEALKSANGGLKAINSTLEMVTANIAAHDHQIDELIEGNRQLKTEVDHVVREWQAYLRRLPSN